MRDIQLLHFSTYAELSNIQIANFMLKFKYRIMTAKEFLKGTSRTKVNIVFQMLCYYLRKEKIHANSRHCSIISVASSSQGLSYCSQMPHKYHMLRMPEDAAQLVYNENRNISERKMMFCLLPCNITRYLTLN